MRLRIYAEAHAFARLAFYVLALQAAHAFKPAVVVSGFALHVLGYFWVRQHQEFFFAQSFYHGFNCTLWFNHAVDASNGRKST